MDSAEDGFLGAAFGDGTAHEYDAVIGSTRPTEAILERLDEWLPSAGTVADVGAGTGEVAAAMADLGRRVIATDVSSAMIERVRARGRPAVEAHVHDITDAVLPGPADAAYCLFNTLFMVGDLDRQAAALRNIRTAVRPGGRLILEVFQASDESYEQDGLYLDPQHLDARSVRLAVSQVRATERVVQMQSLVITNGSISLTPSSFHFCTMAELDAMAAEAGWALVQRWAGWQHETFRETSMNAVSV